MNELLQETNAIASLIDRRLQIKLEIERLDEELKKLDEEIKAEHEPGEILLGSEGYGYRLHIDKKLVYGPQATRFLKARDLLDGFVSISTTKLEKLVKEALENVGLSEAIDKTPAELSGGMRKRLGLARTLILKPEIMLYDEPTTGLDPITSREISELMMKIQKQNKTSSIIIIS